MHTSFKRRGMAPLALTAVFLLTACGGSGSTPASGKSPAPGGTAEQPKTPAGSTPAPASTELTKLDVIQVGQGSYYVTIFAAMAKGFWKEEGLDVSIVNMTTGNATQTLVSGSVPIGITTTDSGSIAFSKGADIRYIASYVTRAPYDLMAQSKYKQLSDLKGQAIAVDGLKTGTGLLMDKWFASQGIKKGEYSLVQSGTNPERLAALQKGAVAAAPLVDPANFIAADQGYVNLGSLGKEPWDFDSWWVNNKWAKENKETVIKFLKGIVKAQNWVDDPKNKDEAIDLITKGIKVDRKYAEKGYNLHAVELHSMAPKGNIDRQAIEANLKGTESLGSFQKVPTIDGFVDTSYLTAAQQAVGK